MMLPAPEYESRISEVLLGGCEGSPFPADLLHSPHRGLPLRWEFVLSVAGHREGCELGVWALAACRWRGIPGKVKSPICRWPA